MLSNLRTEMLKAVESQYAIAGFNVFGVEDARPVIAAAESLNVPTLLMINKLAIDYMPMEYWASMLLPIARDAKVPVSLHLDHCREVDTAIKAMEIGFTSVMYDGSQLPIEENIRNTNIIADEARKYDVTVEGEIGSVPYADIKDRAKNMATSPEMLLQYASMSRADWIAIAIGQIHRLEGKTSTIDFDTYSKLELVTEKPLVIHGGTGIKKEDLERLCKSRVSKVNFGTSLRIAFGEELKKQIRLNEKEYDRLKLFAGPSEAVKLASIESIKSVNKKAV